MRHMTYFKKPLEKSVWLLKGWDFLPSLFMPSCWGSAMLDAHTLLCLQSCSLANTLYGSCSKALGSWAGGSVPTTFWAGRKPHVRTTPPQKCCLIIPSGKGEPTVSADFSMVTNQHFAWRSSSMVRGGWQNTVNKEVPRPWVLMEAYVIRNCGIAWQSSEFQLTWGSATDPLYEGKCLYLQWPEEKWCDGGKKYICAPWQNPDPKLLQTVKVFSVNLLWKNTPTSWFEFEARELVMKGRISSTVCIACCFIGLGLKEEDSQKKHKQ